MKNDKLISYLPWILRKVCQKHFFALIKRVVGNSSVYFGMCKFYSSTGNCTSSNNAARQMKTFSFMRKTCLFIFKRAV